MVDGDAMNEQLSVADGSETAQGLSSTHGMGQMGTAVLDQRVRKPIAKPKKVKVRALDQQDAGRPVSRLIPDIARRGEAELGSSVANVAINEIVPRPFNSSNIAEAGRERDSAPAYNGGTLISAEQAAVGDFKGAELAGDLVGQCTPPGESDDACNGSSVSGHRRKPARPQQFVRMDIVGGGHGDDLDGPEGVDFATPLPTFFHADAPSFAMGGVFIQRYDFNRQD